MPLEPVRSDSSSTEIPCGHCGKGTLGLLRVGDVVTCPDCFDVALKLEEIRQQRTTRTPTG